MYAGLIQKIFDADGWSTQENYISGKNVDVFPNPVNDQMNIEYRYNADLSFIEIINMQGTLIKSQRISNNKNPIDVSDLIGGVYVINVSGVKGVQVGKFVKQ